MSNLGNILYSQGKNDECYTPENGVEPILEYIPPGKTIWCPFDTQDSWQIAHYGSILCDAPAKNSIQLLEDAELYLLPVVEIKKLHESDPYWVTHGKMVVDQIYLKTRSRIEELLCLNAEQRYQKLLKEQPSVFPRIPQKYIASYLGIKPQSLNRIRAHLLT